jgi:hypothetical protein
MLYFGSGMSPKGSWVEDLLSSWWYYFGRWQAVGPLGDSKSLGLPLKEALGTLTLSLSLFASGLHEVNSLFYHMLPTMMKQ